MPTVVHFHIDLTTTTEENRYCSPTYTDALHLLGTFDSARMQVVTIRRVKTPRSCGEREKFPRPKHS